MCGYRPVATDVLVKYWTSLERGQYLARFFRRIHSCHYDLIFDYVDIMKYPRYALFLNGFLDILGFNRQFGWVFYLSIITYAGRA